MATKNKLFEVDMKKENPLVTIIRHGKIPVVQMSNHPFQNKKVEYWYKIYDGLGEDTIKWRQEFIKSHREKGLTNITYCNIGGCLGRDFSHWPCPIENMNIGYLEPDEVVYDETSKTYITAERKFRSIKKAWASLLKKEHEEELVYEKWSYDNKHFADFQEIWCDSKHIKKVITIKVEDYLQLLPYVKDRYLSLRCLSDIFHAVSDKIGHPLLSHLDEANLDEELEQRKTDWNYALSSDFHTIPSLCGFTVDLFHASFFPLSTDEILVSRKCQLDITRRVESLYTILKKYCSEQETDLKEKIRDKIIKNTYLENLK